jgi:ferric-dicitrate binding protein FerR (iron transport regulator)
MPMREVLKKLERWHGVTFTVKNPEILNQKFTGRFKEESISQILELMNRISLVRYEVKDTKITLMSYKSVGN